MSKIIPKEIQVKKTGKAEKWNKERARIPFKSHSLLNRTGMKAENLCNHQVYGKKYPKNKHRR